MIKKFDKETIQSIAIFEEISDVNVIDCVQDGESSYFLVEPGKGGLAIGKNGNKIKKVGRKLKRRIKVFEYSDDEKEFVKNMVVEAENISINNNVARVKIDKKDRGKVIGSGGSNIEKVRVLLRRNSDVKDLKIS